MEESNNGDHFDWDEQKVKGKLNGGLCNEREYEKTDGTVGKSINFAQVCSVEKIRSGKYTIPADKLLSKTAAARPAKTDSDGFMNIPDGVDEELPF